MDKAENRELWARSPEYRKQVIRELEHSGKITKLSPEEFGHLVN